MDEYSALIEKTRVPQPALQKYAVILIFSKLRSAPARLGPNSELGRQAIAKCLCSSNPYVMDQAVRELCRLAIEDKMNCSEAFQELLAALEVAPATSSPLLVKAAGFLTRLGFLRNLPASGYKSSENHPLAKMILSGAEVQEEVVKEVVLSIERCKDKGMDNVCEFLRPFLHFTIFRGSFYGSASYNLAGSLCGALTYFCCSHPDDSFPLLKLLADCFMFLPNTNREEFMRSFNFVELVVEAYMTCLRLWSSSISMSTIVAPYFGIELAENILSLFATSSRLYGCIEVIPNLLKRLFEVHKELKLSYLNEMRSVQVSLLAILLQSDYEHQHISILKLLNIMLEWKYECEHAANHSNCILDEDLLMMMHIIYLMSSGSKYIKAEATSFLTVLESRLISFFKTPEDDNMGQLPSFLYCIFSSEKSLVEGLRRESSLYSLHLLKDYCLNLVHKKKSFSQTTFDTTKQIEFSLFLSCISGALVFNPQSREVALELLTAVGIMEPKLGVAHLLAIFFFYNVLSRKGVDDCKFLAKLLLVLPSLVAHSAMIPLVIPPIKSMIKKDSDSVLHSTGLRLLCKSWEYNDRAFGNLLEVLRSDTLEKFEHEKDLCLSWAASVRDVCRSNPDRGVDIILSVSTCIESRDNKIRAIGFQSLSHLCEADVIDFYTAWVVVSKHLTDCISDPILARSVCEFVRWGSLDAEAYAGNVSSVLHTVWDILNLIKECHSKAWVAVKISAVNSLRQYEVSLMENLLPDYKERVIGLLFNEKNPEVLKEIEHLQTKITLHEHNTRPRLLKETRVTRSKIEKLLDVLPQVLFPSGWLDARKLPGAALICLPEVRMEVSPHEKTPSTIHSKYTVALSEIASSIILSRSTFLALFSLLSWKVFLPSWMTSVVTASNTSLFSQNAPDKTTKIAKEILKNLVKNFEEAIPRSCENALLSVGAFCLVLPASLLSIKSEASKFLLNQLFQYEHEHKQWSAAISLGLIFCYLDNFHSDQKFEIIDGLFQVLRASKSTSVKGACGTALGFTCQCFFKRLETSDNNEFDGKTLKLQETGLLHKIVCSLLSMISAIDPESTIVNDCIESIPLTKDSVEWTAVSKLCHYSWESLDEDMWGVAGLVIGLGYSIDGIYRSGLLSTTLKIKSFVISCIINSVENLDFSTVSPNRYFSLGACYVIPSVIAFCRKVEIMTDCEVDSILNVLSTLISKLLSTQTSKALQQHLLATSCVGAGEVIFFILAEGVWCLEANRVKIIVELFRKCYMKHYNPTIQLGGMIGFANALGCGAGMVHDRWYSSSAIQNRCEESRTFGDPLLVNLVGEPYLTSMIQELFLIAQNCDDMKLQQSASWVVSFIRKCWQTRTKHAFVEDNSSLLGERETIHHIFPENSSVMQLSSWLSNLKASEDGPHQVDIAVTVLRCLTRAPRLPFVDWGLIIRKCMRFEEQEYNLKQRDSSMNCGIFREQCILFSLAHANQFETLLYFLEELCELSRFIALSTNLQRCILIHLSVLMKVFSVSKFDRMLYDLRDIFQQVERESEDYRLLRISCWDGLHDCLAESTENSSPSVKPILDCVKMLFSFLSFRECSLSSGGVALDSIEEWCAAVRCLTKIQNERLLEFLHLNWADEDVHSSGFLKKIVAKAKLVRTGSLPLTELSSLKAQILNYQSNEIWSVLVEVAAAVHNSEETPKRQWLLDTVQISCVSRYPSTAMRFLGLLCGGFCSYAPFLIIEGSAVISDLPVTLTCLLSEAPWNVVAEAVIVGLWTSTDRLYGWITGHHSTSHQPLIDEHKDDNIVFLFTVMHSLCVAFRKYLPMDKQLTLSNMLL